MGSHNQTVRVAGVRRGSPTGLPHSPCKVCGVARAAYCGGAWRRLSRSFAAGEGSEWWWTIFHSPPSRR